jgi:hypothetical protein
MFKRYIWSQLKDLDTGFMSYVLDLMIPVACEAEEKARVVTGIVTSVPSYAIWTKLFAKLRKVGRILQCRCRLSSLFLGDG